MRFEERKSEVSKTGWMRESERKGEGREEGEGGREGRKEEEV